MNADASVEPPVLAIAPEEDAAAYYEYLTAMARSRATEGIADFEDLSVVERAAAEGEVDQPEEGEPLYAATAEMTDAGTALEAGYVATLPDDPPDTSSAIDSIAVMVPSLSYRSKLDGALSALPDPPGGVGETP